MDALEFLAFIGDFELEDTKAFAAISSRQSRRVRASSPADDCKHLDNIAHPET